MHKVKKTEFSAGVTQIPDIISNFMSLPLWNFQESALKVQNDGYMPKIKDLRRSEPLKSSDHHALFGH
jgi:hypothetical protein